MWLNQAPDDLIISTSVSLQETLWHILELHFFCYGYNDWWLTFTARFDLHRSLSYLSNSICSPVAVKIMFINPFTDHFDVIEQHFTQFPLPLSWKYLFFLYPVSQTFFHLAMSSNFLIRKFHGHDFYDKVNILNIISGIFFLLTSSVTTSVTFSVFCLFFRSNSKHHYFATLIFFPHL